MLYSHHSSALSHSSHPPPFDIEQAQASNSSTTQSASEQTSGHWSACLGGEPVLQLLWGHNLQPRRGSAQAQSHQSNITFYFNSIISLRESGLPIYKECTGQTPMYTSAITAGNIPPPFYFPPQQSIESTSVSIAAIAITSVFEHLQQPLSSRPSFSENATLTPLSQ